MLYHKRGKRTHNSIQHVILAAVADAGFLAREQLANHAKKFLETSWKDSRKTDPRYDIPRGVRHLIKRGYLKIERRGADEVLALTLSGAKIFAQITREKFELKKPKRWDGKWRIVIYDIKEERWKLRIALRNTLMHFGFTLIQKSVWAYPYPCEDLLAMIKADFKIGKEVLYMVVDTLENDQWLKKHFNVNI